MKKLIAFDLDGTLTQHKSPLDSANRQVLDDLRKQGYTLLMVGAGQCERIYKQMGEYPIDIIGNYGLQTARYHAGQLEIVEDLTYPCDRESIEKRVTALRQKHGYTSFTGDSVEYHPSGCVTFAILGTRAQLEDKLAFDPDKTKRRAFLEEVISSFPEYTVFIGGTSSFDMAPKPHNKYDALDTYGKQHGFSHEEIVFVGDDWYPGGNDASVYESDIRFVKIYDYRRLRETLVSEGLLK